MVVVITEAWPRIYLIAKNAISRSGETRGMKETLTEVIHPDSLKIQSLKVNGDSMAPVLEGGT